MFDFLKRNGTVLSLCILSVVALALISIFWSLVNVERPNGLTQIAQAGDFFGGFLNPILTFIAFIALVISVLIQQSELQFSREELKKTADAMVEQNFITNFNQILSVHNHVVDSIIAYDSESNEVKGQLAFKAIYSEVRKIYKEKRAKHPKAEEIKAIEFAYGRVFIDNPQLAVYFRFLFNAIKSIELYPNRERYIKLLRSLLSDSELLLLYYNSTVSKRGEKFLELAKKYQLFDNMPAYLLDDRHAKLIDSSAFGPESYQEKKKLRGPGLTGDLRLPHNSL